MTDPQYRSIGGSGRPDGDGPGSGAGGGLAPLITVVMPVYNCERFVAQAVESILDQTLADFELVIIDDGSIEKTPEILRRHAARPPDPPRQPAQPRVGREPERGPGGGPGRVRRGKDGDDIALPGRFERQIAFLREHPEVVCVGAAVLEIDEAGRELVVSPQPRDDETIQELSLKVLPRIWHPTAMMRREARMSVGGYREERKHVEDYDLSWPIKGGMVP